MIPEIQGSDEWKEWRKSKVGASDASAILGISPYKTAYELWEEKSGIRENSFVSDRMQRGIDLEPIARKCYEEKKGIKVEPCIWIHAEFDWMIASLDGISQDNTQLVEIKCLSEKGHMLAKNGKIPDHYYAQLQHQMAVTGLYTCDYFSFDGEDGIIIECTRNNSYISDLIEKEKEFYNCMVTFCPPPQPYVQREDQIWIDTVKKWKDVTSQIKWLESQEKDLRESLIKYSGGSNTKGGGIKLSKEFRKGSVDYKSIPDLQKMDLDIYRKPPTEYWRIIND